MKWILFLALMFYLNAPMWMFVLWGVSFLIDGFVWLIRGVLTIPEMNTVTIPLEEYIELRRKADENLYLATELGAFKDRLYQHEDRLRYLERKVEGNA